jgi:hypothetical protein
MFSKRLTIVAALYALTGRAQFPNVLISTLNSPEEIAIAINPKNTSQLVAGANIDNSYRSADGGATWIHQTLTCTPYNVWGDPVMIWDTANTCYFIHLSNPGSTVPGGSWVDRILIQRSTDYGQTYTNCIGMGKNGFKVQDKPWAVVNPVNNEMHITWTQFDNYGSTAPTDSSIILYSHSTNQGTTWSAPTRISFYAGDCIDSDNTVEGAVPAVGPNGELYVAWAGPKGLVFQKSTDDGATWMATEKIIRPIAGGWDYTINGLQRCNGLPFTFCDLSNGPYRGNIYINYSDHANGAADGDIWIIKSADGGASWSNPSRVNNDVPGKEQFMSAMTIDETTGFVYVVFYDRRNFASGTGTDVYLAVSKDGGNSFSNYKINANSFNPSTNVFFGDYIGITAHKSVVRPVWMQLNAGILSVYTALVDPVILGIYDNKVENLGLAGASPNPFNAEASITFQLQTSIPLTIQLVNAGGKVMSEIATEKKFTAGKHVLNINALKYGLVPGVYYVAFYGDEKSKYVKLIKE